MEELKKLNVTILGKNYSISTNEEESNICNAAKLVDSLMKNVANKTVLKDSSKMAVLVALQLANDLEKTRKQLALWQSKTETLDSLLKDDVV